MSKKLLIIKCIIPAFLILAIFLGINSIVHASSKRGIAKAQISLLSSALDAFNLDMGRYPTINEGLNILLINPLNNDKWDGPYLDKTRIPLDPWNNEYVYIYPAKYGNEKYDLYSTGKNRKDDFGEKDDISNWRSINLWYYRKDIILFKIKLATVIFILWGILFIPKIWSGHLIIFKKYLNIAFLFWLLCLGLNIIGNIIPFLLAIFLVALPFVIGKVSSITRSIVTKFNKYNFGILLGLNIFINIFIIGIGAILLIIDNILKLL